MVTSADRAPSEEVPIGLGEAVLVPHCMYRKRVRKRERRQGGWRPKEVLTSEDGWGEWRNDDTSSKSSFVVLLGSIVGDHRTVLVRPS